MLSDKKMLQGMYEAIAEFVAPRAGPICQVTRGDGRIRVELGTGSGSQAFEMIYDEDNPIDTVRKLVLLALNSRAAEIQSRPRKWNSLDTRNAKTPKSTKSMPS